jgi:hypothetical protein
MVNLLQLYSTDRHLLEVRGNLIIRQLSLNLSPERIYRTLADCLEKEEDLEFASIMVQNLNNNLITAPELSELRKRLRNLDSKVIPPETLSYGLETNELSRMVKCSLLGFSDRGATTPSPRFLSVFLHRPMNRHTISSRSCAYISSVHHDSLLTRPFIVPNWR